MIETRDERRIRLGAAEGYPRFSVKAGKNGQFYWTAVAANHEPIADGCEGYHSEEDCRAGIELLRGGAASWPVVLEVPKQKKKARKLKR